MRERIFYTCSQWHRTSDYCNIVFLLFLIAFFNSTHIVRQFCSALFDRSSVVRYRIVQLVDLLCNVAQAVIGYAISYNVFFGPCMSCDAFQRWSIRRRCTVSPDNLTGYQAHNFKKLNVSHTPSPGEKPFSRLSPNTLLYSLFQVSVLLYYIPPFHYI